MKNQEEFRKAPLPDTINKLSDLMLTPKQSQFIKAYIENKFSINKAMEVVGMNRGSYYKWKDDYPHFAKAIDMCRIQFTDDIEEAFKDLVEERNPQAVMFGLKTLGRDRGYAEKQDVNVTGVAGIKVVFDDVTESKEAKEQ